MSPERSTTRRSHSILLAALVFSTAALVGLTVAIYIKLQQTQERLTALERLSVTVTDQTVLVKLTGDKPEVGYSICSNIFAQ